jgi:CRP-like cAMP-binding protein
MISRNQNPNGLLNALSAEEYSILASSLENVSLAQSDVLHHPGDEIDQVHFLHNGMVSLMAVLRDGDCIETVSIGREGAVGSIAGFEPLRAFTRALVQVPGSASRISAEAFRKVLKKIPGLQKLLTHYHMAVMAQVQQTSACNTLHDAASRLSRLLLVVRDQTGQDVIPLTHECIAQILGVQRTTISITAQALQNAGAVQYHRGHITILNPQLLADSACECYMAMRGTLDEAGPR